MLDGDEFVDFIMSGEFDVLSPKNEKVQYVCFHCGLTIYGYEVVKWINQSDGIFGCPNCDEEIQI